MEKCIEMVPVKDIRVMNPRYRNMKKFKQVIDSIAHVGLKKPITVSLRRNASEGEPHYDLVCGQGRLEAYLALSEEVIPAIVIESSKEDQLLMSLVENLARRKPSTLEQIKSITSMRIPGQSGHRFRGKLDTDSEANWTPIPSEGDHRFRAKAITDSGRSRSPIPDEGDHRFRTKPITC